VAEIAIESRRSNYMAWLKRLIFNHLSHLVEGVLHRHPSAKIVHWPRSATTDRSFH